MNITGYPFQFLALGDPTTGGAAVLSVSLVQGYDSEEFDQLRCVVCWFAEIGGVGGFGGDTVHPSASACELVSPEPSIGPRVEWHFRSLAIDPRSLVVLANLIRDTELDVVQVTVTASGGDLPQSYTPADYPPRWLHLPFLLEESLSSQNVQLALEFSNDLEQPNLDQIADLIRCWSMIGALGGFRARGTVPSVPALLPEDEPSIQLDLLTFCFHDRGLDEVAYDVLLNMCVGIAFRIQGINQVTIEG